MEVTTVSSSSALLNKPKTSVIFLESVSSTGWVGNMKVKYTQNTFIKNLMDSIPWGLFYISANKKIITSPFNKAMKMLKHENNLPPCLA